MWTVVVLLLVMWALGMISKYTLGGMLHLLLIVAIIMAIVSLVRPRAAV
jgi:hypothetical protein